MGTALTVVGLGYVGLPLAQEACRSGFDVVGLDVSEAIVEGLNSGISHIDDLSADDVATMLAAGFRATTDAGCVSSSQVVVICVPTPLSGDGTPDLLVGAPGEDPNGDQSGAAYIFFGPLLILMGMALLMIARPQFLDQYRPYADE